MGVKCVDCVHVRHLEIRDDGKELVECNCPVPVVFRPTPGGPWYADTEWIKCACFKSNEDELDRCAEAEEAYKEKVAGYCQPWQRKPLPHWR